MTEPHALGTLTVGDVFELGALSVGDVFELGAFAFDEPRALSYLEYIVSLGLDTNLEMHLPLSETSGSTASDASGNANDGTYFGATLGEAALVDGFDYSILGPGYIAAPASISDPAVENMTLRFDFSYSGTPANNIGLVGRYPSPYRCDVYLRISTGELWVDYYDGSNLARLETSGIAYNDGAPHSVCLRVDQTAQEIEVWIDGVSRASTSTAAVNIPSGLTNDWRFNNSYVAGSGVTYYGGPTIWSAALSDAQCALMASGVV